MNDDRLSRFTCRGISVKTGKFVHGDYVCVNNRHFIIPRNHLICVDLRYKAVSGDLREIKQEPDQCLGAKDINGNWLHENDEVKVTDGLYQTNYVGTIEWDKGKCAFFCCGNNCETYVEIDDRSIKLKIIGNIHGIESDKRSRK